MRCLLCIHCALIVTAAWLAGCGQPEARESLYHRLQSDDHRVRADAVVEAGRTRDSKAVPYLVDRLADEDADIRLFAIQALRRITGQDFGYRSYESELSRYEAVGRWRHWLEETPP